MTLRYQIFATLILAIFYAVYLGNTMMQKRKETATNQVGKHKSASNHLWTKRIMKVAICALTVGEVISIALGHSVYRYAGKTTGVVLGLIGDAIILLAAVTMGISRKAEATANKHNGFVCKGIFQVSRNPAILGLDLVYISILLMFFNWFLLVLTVFAIVMLHFQLLQKEKCLVEECGEEYLAYKKKVCRYFGRKKWTFWAVIVVVGLAIGFTMINSLNETIESMPDMTCEDCLRYTTNGNPDAVISVGIYKDGAMTYKVYGENGKELENVLHTYEIGSLTKTLTAACINQAQSEGKLNITDTIDKYLDLPAGEAYPTIESLLTHTSGYDGHYLNPQMIWNAIIDDAPFHYVTREQILKEAEENKPADGTYEWNYSNFGYALLGLVLENVYDESYATIMNNYLNELGMTNSAFRDTQGDLGKCWQWELQDAYAPAGAVQSNIMDMLKYASLQLTDDSFANTHQPLRHIGYNDESYDAMNIHIDEIGMAWIVDNENGFVWHNGGTADYNSYLGFCKETNTAVVILSNLPDDYRLAATEMGTKLLTEIQPGYQG